MASATSRSSAARSSAARSSAARSSAARSAAARSAAARSAATRSFSTAAAASVMPLEAGAAGDATEGGGWRASARFSLAPLPEFPRRLLGHHRIRIIALSCLGSLRWWIVAFYRSELRGQHALHMEVCVGHGVAFALRADNDRLAAAVPAFDQYGDAVVDVLDQLQHRTELLLHDRDTNGSGGPDVLLVQLVVVELVRAQLHLSARLAALGDVRLSVQLAPLALVLDREALRLCDEGERVTRQFWQLPEAVLQLVGLGTDARRAVLLAVDRAHRGHLLELEVEPLHTVLAHELHAEPHHVHPVNRAEDGDQALQVELDRGRPPLLRHEVEKVAGTQREVGVGRLRLIHRPQRHLALVELKVQVLAEAVEAVEYPAEVLDAVAGLLDR
eukprot:scaffold17757_cov62-Phaeocystis_antarctica.AAC.3